MNHIALSMLMLGLLLAPVLSWAAEPNADQAKAIAEIKKLGGKVTVDEKSPSKPVKSVDLAFSQATDADLERLKVFTQLQDLDLVGAAITDAGVERLRGLPRLQSLDLTWTKVTDAD